MFGKRTKIPFEDIHPARTHTNFTYRSFPTKIYTNRLLQLAAMRRIWGQAGQCRVRALAADDASWWSHFPRVAAGAEASRWAWRAWRWRWPAGGGRACWELSKEVAKKARKIIWALVGQRAVAVVEKVGVPACAACAVPLGTYALSYYPVVAVYFTPLVSQQNETTMPWTDHKFKLKPNNLFFFIFSARFFVYRPCIAQEITKLLIPSYLS